STGKNVANVVSVEAYHMIAPPTRCRTASSFSVAKKRSAKTPMKNGDTMAAMAVVAYAQPICGPLKCSVAPMYVPMVTNHAPPQFAADRTAGVIVGIVALPLAIAFAIASGLTPERGLYTAIVAGFLISALGGSRVQIGGPTGAFVVIVAGVVQRYGVDGLLV